MRYEVGDWYDEPALYDMVFDSETEREAAFLEAMHRRHGVATGRTCLEPACGTGRLVAAMAARGYRVHGFDQNPTTLRYARNRLRRRRLGANLTRQALDRFRLATRVDLAHCLVSTFKYLRDETAARGHLQAVADVLRPGGVYVLGLHLSEYASEQCSRERWVVRRGSVRVVCNIQTWPPNRRRRRERVRSRLTVEGPHGCRRLETRWWFRTYDARQIRRLIGAVPSLEHVATYDFDYDADRPGSLDGGRLDVVLILRRR